VASYWPLVPPLRGADASGGLVGHAQHVDRVVVRESDVRATGRGVDRFRVEVNRLRFEVEARQKIPRLQMSPTCIGVVVTGQIAERIVQALEAADESLAGLPAKVAGCVLIALGSSAAEHEDLARSLAQLFRSDLLTAVESTVHRTILQIGKRTGEQV
jgi:hypothetical protein